MLARNPKTGGDIRIMTSDAHVWKNRKTLVLMKSGPTKATESWKRWDIAIEGVDAKLLSWKPDIVVLTKGGSDVYEWLSKPSAKTVRFILISSKVVDEIGSVEFGKLALGNVMCLEELSEMYPFIGPIWDGTVEDALVCASVVFRYQRLIGVSSEGTTKRLSELLLKPVNLEVSEGSAPPEPLVLIQQYYRPKEAVRAKELDMCLLKNLENPLIDTIYLFVESASYKLPKSPKLVTILKPTRITYADCIEFIQKKVGSGKLVAFANADIFLDSTWATIWSVNLKDTLLALLRWEYDVSGKGKHEIFGPRSDSQDTWVIHSDSVLDRKWSLEPFNIAFGTAGCDNAILVEFLRNKFKIVNPALSLRTIHVHASEIRTYKKSDIIDRPVYMYVDPNGIHELNPLPTWTAWTTGPVQHEALERPLKATNPKALNMFCSQMNRDMSFAWSADGLNTYNAPADQDHEILIEGGAFVSPTGLAYKHTDLCVGKTELQKELWSENSLSHLMPAQHANTMMCFPLEEAWLAEPALYALNYLSRVLKQHQLTPEASFWCKQSAALLPAFKLFKWHESRGHLLHFSQSTQVFANKVVGRTCHSVKLQPSEVDALRSNLFGGWTSEVSEKECVVIVNDELHIKDELLSSMESIFNEKGATVRIVSSKAQASVWANTLDGASRVILSSSLKALSPTWAWLWMAPKGCKVLELQEEREPSYSLVHLAAAAGLDWTLLQYPRSTPDGFKKIVLKELDKWLQAAVVSTLPLLLVPPKSMKFGFFGHKGDSFRELADMWAERGYVELKEDPIITQCWLGAVGKVMLYDRPTWQWLEKSPESEQVYKVCLAGNPDASEKAAAKPWIFWPRQPKLVERLAAIDASFSERPDNIVFYGRIENDKQGAYRQDISGWQALCSKFSMPVGAKEPYALGPEEYLLALKASKYGLCLRGYGQKCNREIELLAMGTVPLVTPGVDIDGYAEPLIDGIHVVCVKDAASAAERVATITEDEWTTMSKAGKLWWKRNASAEGSWSRTKQYV